MLPMCRNGMCTQVHIFSRNCENKTPMFPDVATNIRAACSRSPVDPGHQSLPSVPGVYRSFIVDSELVAVDREQGGKLRAFQDLSTRFLPILTVDTCSCTAHASAKALTDGMCILSPNQ